MRTLLLAAALFAPLPAAAQDVTCPRAPGMLAGPFVRDEDIAVAIFNAVADPLAGGEDFTGYQIKAEETRGGRAWRVYHFIPGMRGGGVEMVIDKCTGAISNVHYQQ